MYKPACTRPVLIIAPQYSFYSIFVHCEIVVCCPIICADLRGTAPMLLVPASLPPATTKTHSASWPNPRGPQEETSDRRWAARSERGTALLPSLLSGVHYSACSVSTCAGRPLLRPLLTTVLVVKKQNIKPHNPFRYEMSG